MSFDWWTLALQAVNFLVLAWLLQHFLFLPVSQVVAARRAESDRLLADAEAGRKRAQELEGAALKQREGFAKEREAILGAAREAAAMEAKAMLDHARAQADQALAEAKLRTTRQAEEAARDLRRQAARLAGAMAGRLAGQATPPAEAFLPRLIEALAALPEATRQALRSGLLEVASATALSAGTQAALRQSITEHLGADVVLRFVTDPSLIAGLELRGAHASLHGNWAADLETLTARAAGDDGAV